MQAYLSSMPGKKTSTPQNKSKKTSKKGPAAAQNKITVFDYDAKHFEELEIKNIKDAVKYKKQKTVTWINIDNVPPAEFLSELGFGFDLHPVVLEDIENVDQRPKVETLEGYIYIVLKMLTLDEAGRKIKNEQVSLIIADKFLITFQQGLTGDTFESVRRLIRKDGTRTRSAGTDYLGYELIDSIVAGYFTILEKFEDRIEEIEEELHKNPTNKTVRSIHQLKREILGLRKMVWPLREVINILERGDFPLIKKSTRIYLRDVYDRIVQVIDTIETYRDLLAAMLDLYLSTVSQRTNAVMKVLTIITTIFMPLSFLAGVYGMNFTDMPGVHSRYGFPIMLAVMALIFAGMLKFFRKKKWL